MFETVAGDLLVGIPRVRLESGQDGSFRQRERTFRRKLCLDRQQHRNLWVHEPSALG